MEKKSSCESEGRLVLHRIPRLFNGTRMFITFFFIFNFFLFCTMPNKCTIISQIVTLLYVSTLPCHPQGACNQYLAKLHKYFKRSCW